MAARPTFPIYTQMPQRVPQSVWQVVRLLTVCTGGGVILMAFIRPQAALYLFWHIIVPLLPILFFIAPGLWRNICPMAALNQTPRLLRFSRNLNPPNWLKNNAYLIGMVMFFLIVPARKILFNTNGPALGFLLLFAFGAAFIGGILFKGKSGWCSSICPLLPVQRLYGQAPIMSVPNNYCAPCVNCAKNCYDFNPHIANLADEYDHDLRYSGYRRFFAGAFPGLILAFYLIPDPPAISMLAMIMQMAIFILTSLGVFLLLETFLKTSSFKITTLFGAIAFNYYYWFNIPVASETIRQITGVTVPAWGILAAQIVLFLLSAVWVIRTYRKERVYLAQAVPVLSNGRTHTAPARTVVSHPAHIIAPSKIGIRSARNTAPTHEDKHPLEEAIYAASAIDDTQKRTEEMGKIILQALAKTGKLNDMLVSVQSANGKSGED